MKKSSFALSALSLALLGLTALPQAHAAGSLRVYASAPYVSNDTYTGAQIETFNGFTAGTFTSLTSTSITSVTATYTSGGTTTPKPSVNANDIYAASTGSGQYLAITPGDTVTLTLSAAVPYLGIDVAAIDSGNNISFYDANNSLIGTFNAGTINTLFPNNTTSTVTAVNGTTYNTNKYYGQPTAATPPAASGNNAAQAYAYLHFFGQNGTTIKSVVFSESAGGNFETENDSVLTTAPTVDGTFVSVGAVPEPGVGATIAAGCLGLLALSRLSRRTQ